MKQKNNNQTSWRGILFLISSKYFNPNFCEFVSESSFFRSSSARYPFSYSFSAVAGPIPQISPNKFIVRTWRHSRKTDETETVVNCQDIRTFSLDVSNGFRFYIIWWLKIGLSKRCYSTRVQKEKEIRHYSLIISTF